MLTRGDTGPGTRTRTRGPVTHTLMLAGDLSPPVCHRPGRNRGVRGCRASRRALPRGGLVSHASPQKARSKASNEYCSMARPSVGMDLGGLFLNSQHILQRKAQRKTQVSPRVLRDRASVLLVCTITMRDEPDPHHRHALSVSHPSHKIHNNELYCICQTDSLKKNLSGRSRSTRNGTQTRESRNRKHRRTVDSRPIKAAQQYMQGQSNTTRAIGRAQTTAPK